MNNREKSAFNKGAAARRRGKADSENPYTHETSIQSANHWAWKRGYDEQGKAAHAVIAND